MKATFKANYKMDMRSYKVFILEKYAPDGRLISRKVETANPKIIRKIPRLYRKYVLKNLFRRVPETTALDYLLGGVQK